MGDILLHYTLYRCVCTCMCAHLIIPPTAQPLQFEEECLGSGMLSCDVSARAGGGFASLKVDKGSPSRSMQAGVVVGRRRQT